MKRNVSFQYLIITGHSLGGALATLAVPDIHSNTSIGPKLVMYNFGSPRVGGYDFTQSYNRLNVRSFRFVNTEDLAPTLPQSIQPTIDMRTFFYYKHVGEEVNFTAQYFTSLLNHSLQYSYAYAMQNLQNPEGPIPSAAKLGKGRLIDVEGADLAAADAIAHISP